MNLEEAFEAEVTEREAIREVENHGCTATEFLAEVKPLESGLFLGCDVLQWLGY